MGQHVRLVRLMITEELRLNSGMIGRVQFLMFPLMILAFSFLLAVASPQLLRTTSLDDVYTILHSLILVYGLGVGSFALIGERMATRRFGEVTLLLQTPTLLPVRFRTLFLAFYVKDVIYYLVYTIAPLIGGMALSIPLTGFRVTSVLFLLLTLSLSFLIGISLSFALSSAYVRWKRAFGAIVAVLAAVTVLVWAGGWGDLSQLLPSLMLQRTAGPLWLALSASVILTLSAAAVLTLQVRYGSDARSYEPGVLATAQRFRFAGGGRVFAAKEWIDLVRSRTLIPVASAYVGSLLFLALLFWFVEGMLQVRMPINLMFYSAMIGFFSVSIYGWLNLLDAPAFLEVLPVTVSEIVRAKLLLLSLFAIALSSAFLVGLSVARNETDLLPLALLVGYASTAYTVFGTAYLTGLRTNNYLFDPRILARFAAMCIPPLCALVLLSLNYGQGPSVVGPIIAGLSVLLLVGGGVLFRRIDRRWSRESFLF